MSASLTTQKIAAVFRVPPHLVDGNRVRFWRLRGVLIRARWRLRR